MIKLPILLLCILLACSTFFAQELPLTMADVPAACEQNGAYIYNYNVERLAHKKISFVIVRAGDGEGTKVLNHRYNIVTKYLKEYIGSYELVYARGERVSGQGRVELYIAGDLYLTMFAKKGRVPCMNCCGYDFQRGKW